MLRPLFKKLSAAEASESVYMRERLNDKSEVEDFVNINAKVCEISLFATMVSTFNHFPHVDASAADDF